MKGVVEDSVVSTNDREGDDLVLLGAYSPPKAERILAALEKADIYFEIECDDGIRPGLGQRNYGMLASIAVWVAPDNELDARKISGQMFG